MTAFLRVALLSGATAAAIGCASLPTVQDGQCGNGVVEAEAGEDCDGGERCGLPGSGVACRTLCDEEDRCADGTDCGVDGVCRAPAQAFELLATLPTNNLRDLLIADVDGDDCDELLVTGRRGNELYALPSLIPGFCEAAERDFTAGLLPEGMAELLPLPIQSVVGQTAPGELTFVGEGLAGQGLYVIEADEGAALSSTMFGSLPSTLADGVPVRILYGERDAALFLGVGAATSSAALVDDPRQPVKTVAGYELGMSRPVVVAAEEPVSSMGCPRVYYGEEGAMRLKAAELCPPAMTMPPTPPSLSALPDIQLPAGRRLGELSRLSVVDLERDGGRDLVLSVVAGMGGEQEVVVAYGRGDGTFHSSPVTTEPADQAMSRDETLEPGGMSADALLVVLDPDELEGDATDQPVETTFVPCPPMPSVSTPNCSPVRRRCEAVVADIDRDGDLDVVANEGAQAGLAIRLQTNGDFPVSYLDTNCPPVGLSVAELDGDGNPDVAFIDQTVRDDQPVNAISVAWGRGYAVPDEPMVQGTFDGALTMVAGRFESMEGPGMVLQPAETDQLVALRRLSEPVPSPMGDPFRSQMAIVEGGTQRLALAPFLFPPSMGSMNMGAQVDVDVLATAAGRFVSRDGELRSSLAAITQTRDGGEVRLWLLEPTFDNSDLAPEDSDGLISCDGCVMVAFDLDEATPLDEVLLLGDGEVRVYEAVDGTFVEQAGSPIPVRGRFFTRDDTGMPDTYFARPVVDDVDGDGHIDVLAVDDAGRWVALWGDGAGGLVEETLFEAPPACPTMEVNCPVPRLALIEVDGTPGPELVVLAPPGVDGRLELSTWLRLYDWVDGRELEPIEAEFDLKGAEDLPPMFNADVTALAVGDGDGDGVDDIAMAVSSSALYLLRGEPDNE